MAEALRGSVQMSVWFTPAWAKPWSWPVGNRYVDHLWKPDVCHTYSKELAENLFNFFKNWHKCI